MSLVSGITWLESVDAKIDRAHEHLDVIKNDITEFRKSAKHHLHPKRNPSTNEAWLVWWMNEPHHPPLSISVRIGEFLYNLRSALDNLVCALVRHKKGHVSCSGNAFPIHTDCDVFDRESARTLKDVPPKARTLIQGLQPYSRGNQAADKDPLNILNVLRNRDMHRALNLGLVFHRNTEIILLHPGTDNVIYYVTLLETIYPSTGPQTIPLPQPASELPERMDAKFRSAAGIRFREEGPWDDRTVEQTLVTCLEYVEQRVIARFKPFFD